MIVKACGDPSAIVPRPRDIDEWLSAYVRAYGTKRPIAGRWRVSWQGDGFLWEKVA